MRKKTNKFLIVCILFFLFILSACSTKESQIDETGQISGAYEDKEAVLTTRDLLMSNLQYAETENIEGYLSTIPSDAHADTREAMEGFFEAYDVSHTLLEFEVIEELEDELVVKTKQETIGEDETGDTEYRNHIAEVLHVFQKNEDEWKITESSVTDVIFID